MRDDNNRIDREIIESSWNEMRGILDKEMPVRRSSRVLWIFLLFFGFTAATFGYKYIDSRDSNKSAQVNPQEQLSIANNIDEDNNPMNNVEKSINTEASEITENETYDLAAASSSDLEVASLNASKSKNTDIYKNGNINITTSKPDSKEVSQELSHLDLNDGVVDPDSKLEQIEEVATPLDVNNNYNKTESLVSETNLEEEERSHIEEFPTLIIPSFRISENSFINFQPLVISPLSRPHYGLFSHLSTRITNTNSITGEFALGYEIEVASSLSSYFGMGIGIDNFNYYSNGLASVDRTAFNAFLVASAYNINPEVEFVTDDYLSLMTGLNYFPLKKLSLGVELGFRDFRKIGFSNNEDALLANDVNAGTPAEEGDLNSENQSSNATYMLNNMIYGSLNIEYLIHPRLGIRLGLLSQFNNPGVIKYSASQSQNVITSNELSLSKRKEIRIGLKYRM